MSSSNQEIAKLLRTVAAALTIKKGNIFEIRAYQTAADGIEHLTAEVKDLWKEDKLDEIPGVGKNIKDHLEEYFKMGKVRHFEFISQGIKPVVFELLDIPGVGPKAALNLAKLGVKSLTDLENQIKNGQLVKKGLSAKIAEKIMIGLEELSGRTGRMLLPYATYQAQKILDYLKSSPGVKAADPLGSLRRQVATIGDLDFAAASKNPKIIIDHFVEMPSIVEVVERGENKATVILASGLQVDLLVGQPASYGALLQHFTGSKAHNIKLRTFAEKKGLSLSEYGAKDVKTGKLHPTKTEQELYRLLNMQTPPPEIREDSGEIEAALKHQLPHLIELEDIRGDLHLHSNYPITNPSHGPGADSIEEIIKKAQQLGYSYVGISDHSPGYTSTPKDKIIDWVAKRTKFIQNLKKKTKSIRVLNGLEIDILGDGNLSVPDESLITLDYCVGGIHSGHRGSKEIITKRLLRALKNPNVDAISHPTNRLLNERQSSEADWETIFKFCAKNKKLLEINGYPNRLDLRDDLVRLALKFGVKFIINTDAHEISQMDNMPYGVAVGRRGWATKADVVNSWDWTRFSKWFRL